MKSFHARMTGARAQEKEKTARGEGEREKLYAEVKKLIRKEREGAECALLYERH